MPPSLSSGRSSTSTRRTCSAFERMRYQRRRFEGVPIRTNLDQEEVARLAVNGHRFPGVDVRAHLLRSYPLGEHTAHVLSYVGRINEKELKRIDASDYAGTRLHRQGGRGEGVRGSAARQRGTPAGGGERQGRVAAGAGEQPPGQGRICGCIWTSVSSRMRQPPSGIAAGPWWPSTRAPGVSWPWSAARASIPTCSWRASGPQDYKALRDSPDKPLFNRAIRGQYPPGSTVKPFVGLGGLETGAVGPPRPSGAPASISSPGTATNTGAGSAGGTGPWPCRRASSSPATSISTTSPTTWAIDRLHDFLGGFGFGERTGIDVSGELGGLLPSKEWKQRARNEPWFPGETLIVGIGQGAYSGHALQLAAATAALAARGRYVQPRVARATEVPGSEAEREIPAVSVSWSSRRQRVDDVIAAMTAVVHTDRGTAKRIRTDAYRIAGKTGTAQVFTVGQKERYRESEVPSACATTPCSSPSRRWRTRVSPWR